MVRHRKGRDALNCQNQSKHSPFLYDNFQELTRRGIAVTQPRILTAIDIAEGLPEHYSYMKMDDNLGYSTGDYKREPKNKGVTFMTTGILLAQLKVMTDEMFMKKYESEYNIQKLWFIFVNFLRQI